MLSREKAMAVAFSLVSSHTATWAGMTIASIYISTHQARGMVIGAAVVIGGLRLGLTWPMTRSE